MKKFILYTLLTIISLTCLYDWTNGSLKYIAIDQPQSAEAKTKLQKTPSTSKPFQNVTVQTGDTVLSIIERLNPNQVENISKMINDFQLLNPKQNPNQIKIGESYRFPLYKDK
ncbi:regulatory protein YycH of two-component signal transduction system YycFG [Pullulanibacillus pueri]|uniref:LysM domain-containing protein n=1 Tax=Pullulanibacillus pueri TaxID=1437324 RepID=A0A8J2ZUY1_9BACL|nr:hypothetical protein [Pullulanibacillus pueri]MBM7681528.1 regulatory protein YycH of two-component signal transduction system YycFG [Pullulanibacillus pueri]GGH79796.1 hypothetical protein GCM10007096_15260 [Pullulanibacillus pueri]